MAAPTVTGLTAITTEGLISAGFATPTAAQLTRAQTYWVREIKSDIARRLKKPITFQSSACLVTDNGQSRYSNPSDYHSGLTLTAIHGTKIGVATGGSISTVIFPAGHGYTEADLLGKEIFIYESSGQGSLSQCVGLSTNTASVTPDFTSAPANGSKYMIVETYSPLSEDPIWDRDNDTTPTTKGEPTNYRILGDADYGEFEVYPVPYNATAPYGLKMRYYADLKTADVSSTALATFYKKYESLFIQGVLWRALRDINDDREEVARGQYWHLLSEMVGVENYGVDLHNMQMAVSE